MSDYVAKYTCGTCKYYEYEGQYTKGYCSWYKTYYYHNDSCRNWEESSSYSGSSSGGCFLTSACCNYKGLPDDCEELRVMREFRDTQLKKTTVGRELIQMYYRIAPQIVEKIDAKDNHSEIYRQIYEQIQHIVLLLKESLYDEAVAAYVNMVLFADTVTEE